MAIPPITPAAITPAPATPVLEAPLAAPVAEATALEAWLATLLTLLEAPDAAEEPADRTLEADWEADEAAPDADEAAPPDELAEEVVDAAPPPTVWEGRSLPVRKRLDVRRRKDVRGSRRGVTSGGDSYSRDGGRVSVQTRTVASGLNNSGARVLDTSGRIGDSDNQYVF